MVDLVPLEHSRTLSIYAMHQVVRPALCVLLACCAHAALAANVTYKYTYDPASNRLYSVERLGSTETTAVGYSANGNITRVLPAASDSDADGLSAHDELRVHATDPVDSDTDADGVTDGTEVSLGINPILADTDADGLVDGDELAVNADPLSSDTDSDGMRDGSEVDVGRNPTLNEPAAIAPTVYWYLFHPEQESE